MKSLLETINSVMLEGASFETFYPEIYLRFHPSLKRKINTGADLIQQIEMVDGNLKTDLSGIDIKDGKILVGLFKSGYSVAVSLSKAEEMRLTSAGWKRADVSGYNHGDTGKTQYYWIKKISE